MRMPDSAYHLAEDYLKGALPPQARAAFEAQMAQDDDLRRWVDDLRPLLDTFEAHARRRVLKARLAQYHPEQWQPGAPARTRTLWERWWPTVAVAATVALLTVGSTLWLTEHLRAVEASQQTQYLYLKREVDQLRREQRALQFTLDQQAQPTAPPRYDGTGFALSSEGHVLTNLHLVQSATAIFVEAREAPRRRFAARVARSFPEADLAILEIADTTFRSFGELPYTFLASPADLGEEIYTLAFPQEDMVYGTGVISSRHGFEGDTNAYQVSIPVNPGNSGGPVFDPYGQVVGMISGKKAGAEGVAYALKSQQLLRFAQSDTTLCVRLPVRNQLQRLPRTQQLRRISPFVFHVRVY